MSEPDDTDEEIEFHAVLFDPDTGKMKDWIVSNSLVALAKTRTSPKFISYRAMWFQFKIGTNFTNPMIPFVNKPN